MNYFFLIFSILQVESGSLAFDTKMSSKRDGEYHLEIIYILSKRVQENLEVSFSPNPVREIIQGHIVAKQYFSQFGVHLHLLNIKRSANLEEKYEIRSTEDDKFSHFKNMIDFWSTQDQVTNADLVVYLDDPKAIKSNLWSPV